MAAALKQMDFPGSSEKILAFPHCATAARITPAFELGTAERIDLDRLRWLALRSVITPHPDLERACFLLSGETDVSLARFANAFFHGLANKGRRSMDFYRPGAKTVGDDETWLLRLVAAWRKGDEAGARALVAWRVQPEAQRWMRFLSAGLVRMLDSAE